IEQRARALGVEHFIAKPFTTARLLGTVRGTLERFTQLRDAGVVRASVPTVAAAPDVVATGIGPLDEMLGGLGADHAYYVSAEAGGETDVVAIQFVYHALQRGESAVMVTTDHPSVVLRTATRLGLDLTAHAQ